MVQFSLLSAFKIGFLQYDKTYVFDGRFTIINENLFKLEIEDVFAGVATIKRYTLS